MKRTYTAVFNYAEADPLRDGLAGVFNFDQGGSRVRILSVRMSSPSQWGKSGVPGNWELVRTSSQDGGTDVSVASHGSGSLSNLVLARECPDSVTIAESFRRQCDAINAWWSQAFQPCARFHGKLGGSGAEFYWASGASSVQGIFLEEGEGVAIVQRSFERPRNFHVSVTFRNADGDTFSSTFHAGTPSISDQPVFGIFNGVGSGETLEIISVQLAEEGSTEPPNYRLVLLDGYEEGIEIQPSPHQAGSTPSGIVCLSGGFRAAPLGEKSAGVPISWHTVGPALFSIINQHKVGTVRRKYLGPLNPASCPPSDQTLLYEAPRGAEGIELTPGVGIGVVNMSDVRNDSAYAYANIAIVFSQEFAPGVSASRVIGGL